jgi:hypothetical protein
MSGGRRARIGAGVIATLALAALCLLVAGMATAGSDVLRDRKGDSRALKSKPEIDIARVLVADEAGRRLKFKITMHGKLRPQKTNTRPFILINTRGGKTSEFEYVVLGPRVFKAKKRGYEKVGANKFVAKKSTWIYRFKPRSIGLRDGDTFGWAVLTAKGRTTDLAPNKRYRSFTVDLIPPA